MFKLKNELTELEREERLLNLHLTWMKQSIRNVCEHQENTKHAFTTQADLMEAFPDSLAMALQAPPTTSVEVSSSGRAGYAEEMRFDLKLTSKCGPAQVYLLNNTNKEGSQAIGSSSRGRSRNTSQHQQNSAYNVSDEPGDILEGDTGDNQSEEVSQSAREQQKKTNSGEGDVDEGIVADGFRSLTPPRLKGTISTG
uniref:E2F transcription factor CC-MB domain-containing protein n=1 Tax=Ditylenchus dipsaci TaxID=166011 RepID=A0A915E689_9BILA